MNYRAVSKALAILVTMLGGCSRHLVFAEHSHLGLKASFQSNNPTPAEVDLGWRRALFAMVPQKSAGRDDSKTGEHGSVTVQTENGATVITVVPDPDELMSMYSVYRGNVGFGDPIHIYHFLATGVAASNLLASDGDLRKLAEKVQPTTGGGHQ